jgi:hypothetical protein
MDVLAMLRRKKYMHMLFNYNLRMRACIPTAALLLDKPCQGLLALASAVLGVQRSSNSNRGPTLSFCCRTGHAASTFEIDAPTPPHEHVKMDQMLKTYKRQVLLKFKVREAEVVKLSGWGYAWNKRATVKESQGGAARKPNKLTQRETLSFGEPCLLTVDRTGGRTLIVWVQSHEDGTVAKLTRLWMHTTYVFCKLKCECSAAKLGWGSHIAPTNNQMRGLLSSLSRNGLQQ